MIKTNKKWDDVLLLRWSWLMLHYYLWSRSSVIALHLFPLFYEFNTVLNGSKHTLRLSCWKNKWFSLSVSRHLTGTAVNSLWWVEVSCNSNSEYLNFDQPSPFNMALVYADHYVVAFIKKIHVKFNTVFSKNIHT